MYNQVCDIIDARCNQEVHCLSCSRLNYKYTIGNTTRQCYYFSIQSAAEGKIAFFCTALVATEWLTRRQWAVFQSAKSVYVPVAITFYW